MGAAMARYLLLSDIHSNLTALEATLAAAEGLWDHGVCLGDVVGYGPDPNPVIDRIIELGVTTIRGNHDRAASTGVCDSFNPSACAAIEWTLGRIRPENLRWLQGLPTGPLSEAGMTFVHGSVDDEDEYILSADEAARSLQHSPSPVTFFGHTHVQGGFQLRNRRIEGVRPSFAEGSDRVSIDLDPAAKYLINPGSVGQPRDGDPRAAFATADTGRGIVEFRRVAYDIASVQERMEAAGLPEPLVLRLAFGR